MKDEVGNEIEGVSSELLAAVASVVPALPYMRGTFADRFAQEVRSLIDSRAQNNWPGESDEDVAVFVQVKYPRKTGEDYRGTDFVDPVAQDIQLLGRLFFCNFDASHGQFISMPTSPNGIINWLEENNLGNRPFVIAYRTSKKIVTRLNGTESYSRNENIREIKPSATLDELTEALKYFQLNNVLTPTLCLKGVWERGLADKYIPGPKPEKTIQADLERTLSSYFHGVVRAVIENRTGIGRIDISLLKKDPNSRFKFWVILELKVVKSFTNARSASDATPVSTRKNCNAIVEGIKQAYSYRENWDAEYGMLEVYDMRKDKSESLLGEQTVLSTLSKYNKPPNIRVWSVFGSASDARDAGYTGV